MSARASSVEEIGTPESTILWQILHAWGRHPRLKFARVNTGGAMIKGRLVRFNPPGTADIVGIAAPSGRMVMLECKTAKGKQREAQIVMQRVVTSMGGVYAVCRSLADADAVLTPLVGARE